MNKDNISVPERFIEEKLGDHWSVNENPQSFDKLQNHLTNNTNMFSFFYKAVTKILDFYNPQGLIVADIGGGIGWTSCILASFPQIKKIYLIDPSISRLEKVKHVIDHYKIDKSKIVITEGNFLKFNLPEKVDIFILNGSFHHCSNENVDKLFDNIRVNLKDRKYCKYIDYKGEQKIITFKPKILIAGEHYLNKIVILKRLIFLILSTFYIIKPRKDLNGNLYNIKNLNPPVFFSGEQERTKKQVIKLFKKSNFKFKIIKHKEDNLKNKKNIFNFYKFKLTYFYSILE